jgi:hypothetical protein
MNINDDKNFRPFKNGNTRLKAGDRMRRVNLESANSGNWFPVAAHDWGVKNNYFSQGHFEVQEFIGVPSELVVPPEFIKEEWSVSHKFPGQVISGSVENSPKGFVAMVICSVMGNALKNFKEKLQVIAAVPKMLRFMSSAYSIIKDQSMSSPAPEWDNLLREAREVMTCAGFKFGTKEDLEPKSS